MQVNSIVKRTNKRSRKLYELKLWWIFYEEKWERWRVWFRRQSRRPRQWQWQRQPLIVNGIIGCLQFLPIVSRTMWVDTLTMSRVYLVFCFFFLVMRRCRSTDHRLQSFFFFLGFKGLLDNWYGNCCHIHFNHNSHLDQTDEQR